MNTITDAKKLDNRGMYFLLFVFAALFSFSHNAWSQNAACDPDYYESLESRAWMEAQREIEQNQNLIVKPDSVLEYTCFNGFGDELAQHAFDMFSETDEWSPPVILPPDSMDNALTNLVGTSLKTYQEANFNHKSLGGRGINKHQFSGTISGGTYTCDQMDKIWQKSPQTAKCYNFQTLSHDSFFTFKDYETEKVRALPQECNVDPRWADQNKKALGKYIGYADGDTPWDEDREFKYLDMTKACAQSPKIITGLKVIKTPTDAGTPEYVCLIPGCYYDGGTCKAAP